MRIKLEVIISEVGCIASTWSCTKSSWLLKPMDDYYPLEAETWAVYSLDF